jgi:hypothetical protein
VGIVAVLATLFQTSYIALLSSRYDGDKDNGDKE